MEHLSKRISHLAGRPVAFRSILKACLVGAMLLLFFPPAPAQQTSQHRDERVVEGRPATNTNPLTLWYPAPAHLWTDALAIGNGRLGAMVYGAPEHERLQLNDITVWSGGPQNKADRAEAYRSLPAIREALRSGDYALATRLVSQHMTTTGKGDSEYWASYETLGDLNFEHALPPGTVSNYWRWLDIGTAVSGVEFTLAGAKYRRESFASAPDGVVVTHLECDHPGKISFTLRLSRIASATTKTLGEDTLVMRGNTDLPPEGTRAARPGNLDYEAQVRVTAVGGSVRKDGDHLTVSGADEATVVLAAGTSYILDYAKDYNGADPHQAVTATLAKAANKSFVELKAAH